MRYRFEMGLTIVVASLLAASVARAGEWENYKRISPAGAHNKTHRANTGWQTPAGATAQARKRRHDRGYKPQQTPLDTNPGQQQTHHTLYRHGNTSLTVSGPKDPQTP